MAQDRRTGGLLVVEERIPQPISFLPDSGVSTSRERCLTVHCLTPDRIGRPLILTSTELREHREPVADLLALAQGEVQRLFELLLEQDYIVMLTDADGITMDFRSNNLTRDTCDRVGMLPGALWVEELQGTNGIGLCIKEQRPVSVVMADHFATSLEGLSCTVAPIFGAAGELVGVLNVTTQRPSDHAAQSIVRKVVSASARRIENLFFDRRNAANAILRLSHYGDFGDAAFEARLALNASGCIVDATPSAHRILSVRGVPIIGQPLSAVSGMEDWQHTVHQRDASVHSDNGKLFLRLEETRHRPNAVALQSVARPRIGTAERPSVEELVGDDSEIRNAISIARRLIAHKVPILLQGETGTGKSALARAIHIDAGGDENKFVSVNCAAITAELIESELFGYRPGAFTGASRQGSRGRLLEADGGMLFLDEIGDMPLALQTRFLQVLSDGEFVPVGATHPVRVNFALIAASLHDIEQLVREGKFREDLYFRLAGATVRLPALRYRDDRTLLIDRAFEQAARKVGKRVPRIDERARKALSAHPWPGNLRELHHAARFAVAIDADDVIGLEDLPSPLGCPGSAGSPHSERGKRNAVEAALQRSNWNVSVAATSLGVSRSTLHRQMRVLGIERPAD